MAARAVAARGARWHSPLGCTPRTDPHPPAAGSYGNGQPILQHRPAQDPHLLYDRLPLCSYVAATMDIPTHPPDHRTTPTLSQSSTNPGLASTEPTLIRYCQCDQSCSAWRAHPLGRPFAGPNADRHFAGQQGQDPTSNTSDERLVDRGAVTLGNTHRRNGGVPGRGRFLVALGSQACEVSGCCFIPAEELYKLEPRGGLRGVCSAHKGDPEACWTKGGKCERPFGKLVYTSNPRIREASYPESADRYVNCHCHS